MEPLLPLAISAIRQRDLISQGPGLLSSNPWISRRTQRFVACQMTAVAASNSRRYVKLHRHFANISRANVTVYLDDHECRKDRRFTPLLLARIHTASHAALVCVDPPTTSCGRYRRGQQSHAARVWASSSSTTLPFQQLRRLRDHWVLVTGSNH